MKVLWVRLLAFQPKAVYRGTDGVKLKETVSLEGNQQQEDEQVPLPSFCPGDLSILPQKKMMRPSPPKAQLIVP